MTENGYPQRCLRMESEENKKIPSQHNNISWKDFLFKHGKGVKTWLSSLSRKTANVHLVDDFSLFEFSCFFFSSFLLFTKRCIRMKSIWIFCVFVFILSNISKWEMWWNSANLCWRWNQAYYRFKFACYLFELYF